MAVFEVYINTDGAAFEGDPTGEVADILGSIITNVRYIGLHPDEVYRLKDANGNRVGYAIWKTEE